MLGPERSSRCELDQPACGEASGFNVFMTMNLGGVESAA
jgi:hypothetical protein